MCAGISILCVKEHVTIFIKVSISAFLLFKVHFKYILFINNISIKVYLHPIYSRKCQLELLIKLRMSSIRFCITIQHYFYAFPVLSIIASVCPLQSTFEGSMIIGCCTVIFVGASVLWI